MFESALKYHQCGLSVIPIGAQKVPLGAWKNSQSYQVEPNIQAFSTASGLGVVTGKVSGGLELIDIDTKYDITGTLFKDYCDFIKLQDDKILKKLVIEKTPSGGWHFIYRCKEIQGNQKLAKRGATAEELLKKPNEKQFVLIETRGEGGYFQCDPSPGYKLKQLDFSQIPEITAEERKILFDSARSFNEVFVAERPKYIEKPTEREGLSPFEDYNNRGDVLGLLESEGWKVTLQKGSKYFVLRPGGTGKWSADFDADKRLLYVFTTSSEFESEKAYNPSQVVATLKFGGDYSKASHWMIDMGYGEKRSQIKAKQQKTAIVLDDDNYEFVASKEEADIYINQIRNGTFQFGLETGIKKLDDFWRWKLGTFNIILGHDNVGKSTFFWYLAVLCAKVNGLRFCIYSSENKIGGVKRRLIEFFIGHPIKNMSEDQLKAGMEFVEKHFTLIKNDDLYSYTDMLVMFEKLLLKEKYDAFLIDPYNSLIRDSKNYHEYDYKATSEMRLFCTKTGTSIYLNCHAVTEALRRVFPKEHELAGFPMSPGKADAEGGGKFANKADDLLVFHRLTQHPQLWNTMEVHVKKIKETETGGKVTMMELPFKMRMLPNQCGYEDLDGFNPMKIESSSVLNKPRDPDEFLSPKRPTEPIPF